MIIKVHDKNSADTISYKGPFNFLLSINRGRCYKEYGIRAITLSNNNQRECRFFSLAKLSLVSLKLFYSVKNEKDIDLLLTYIRAGFVVE